MAQGGEWVSTIYKIEEKVNKLNSQLLEVEDRQRLTMNQIDDSVLDLKNAITEKEKLIIGRKISKLRSKLVVYHKQKNTLLKAIRDSMNKVPKRHRDQIIRDLKIENRFNSITAIVDDVDNILHPKAPVAHKQSTKAAIKRLGHSISDEVKF